MAQLLTVDGLQTAIVVNFRGRTQARARFFAELARWAFPAVAAAGKPVPLGRELAPAKTTVIDRGGLGVRIEPEQMYKVRLGEEKSEVYASLWLDVG